MITALAAVAFWVVQLGLEQAWAHTDGSGVTVAVLDTGVDPGHADLAGVVLPGAEFPELGSGARDTSGHGTDIAALIAGRSGVAPGARVLPVKVTGGSAAANAALKWAVDRGAKVVNLSLGSGAGSFDEGLRYAAEHDVLVVAAAGNTGTDRGVTPLARGEAVLAVSAVDRDGRFRPDVSVSGPEVVLAAPGVDVPTSRGDRSGTSYAAAIVSGTAALARARYPDLTAPEVFRLLTNTAKDVGPMGRDPQYGFGIVDPARALAAAPPKSNALGVWTWPFAGIFGVTVAGLAIRRNINRNRSGDSR
ncbi:S8 family serine peptidase [Saccharothrix isguenensis]